MITIRVGRRGQVTIPKDIRLHLGIKEGDSIAIIPQGEQAILRVIPITLLDLRGSVTVSGVQDFNQIRQQVLFERTKQDRDGS